ncbi:MAG: nitroreductase family deazaflavin-dependent oxidoreductase [Chloroflexi bacterium]|nr:nitroreductase family deazaflavin-dependent oxidoreductase [Chloroflexota bacterium]
MSTVQTKSQLFLSLSGLLRHPSMRPLVRFGSRMHVFLYRVTGGKAQMAQYPTMLLTVRGRKTGKLFTTPLIYVQDQDRYVIAAAYSGSDRDPIWWLNLQAHPEAELQVLNQRLKVRAALALPAERQRLWQSLSAMYPYFTDYEARTTREIPIIVLTPIIEA